MDLTIPACDSIWLNCAADDIQKKMIWVSEKSKTKIPYTTVDGVHDDKSVQNRDFRIDDGINWWCNGFWGGMLWLMYARTGDDRYASIARGSEEKLERCFEMFYGLHHDVGFMYIPTSVANYKLTGCPDARRRALHAANLLAGRYNPAGRFIRAWNDIEGEKDTRGWAIIDSMLNIPLLYWASEETNDPRFRQIAVRHASTVAEHFIRPDGSVRHIVEFDPETGCMLRDYGGQGYRQGSAWTRGQAWGICGFILSYIHTGKPEYLQAATHIARFFIANIPDSHLIPSDFQQPPDHIQYDDTAAAIAAGGLLEIAQVVAEPEKSFYQGAALQLLKALYTEHCNFNKDSDGMIEYGSGSFSKSSWQQNIIYGDYYFMEAVFKLTGQCPHFW